MLNLPTEIVSEILHHVPKSSLAECRLVCRSFAAIAFPVLFSFIPKWLDWDASRRAILDLPQDLLNRPPVMWSPMASEPDDPVDGVWMNIVWKVLKKSEPPRQLTMDNGIPDECGMPGDSAGNNAQLTCHTFAELSGRKEMTEYRLRTCQNRYLMHREYASKVMHAF